MLYILDLMRLTYFYTVYWLSCNRTCHLQQAENTRDAIIVCRTERDTQTTRRHLEVTTLRIRISLPLHTFYSFLTYRYIKTIHIDSFRFHCWPEQRRTYNISCSTARHAFKEDPLQTINIQHTFKNFEQSTYFAALLTVFRLLTSTVLQGNEFRLWLLPSSLNYRRVYYFCLLESVTHLQSLFFSRMQKPNCTRSHQTPQLGPVFRQDVNSRLILRTVE